MSELQAAEGEIAPTENVEQETQEVEQSQEEASDLAPDTAEQPEEKITFTEEQQAIFNEEIGKKTYKLRQTEREKEELAKELEEIRSKIPQPAEPTIPPMPDIYDDDFESKMKARDEAIVRHAEYRREQQLRQQQQQEQELLRRQQAEQAIVSKVQDYTKRATALGVDAQELAQAGQRLQGHVTDDVVGYILESDKGPLMTKYLAANPLEVDKLSQLNPMQAAVYLETQVKPKATQYGVKKPSSAPEPAETLSGRGVSTESGPSGATFE